MATLKELREIRIQKLNRLRELGIDPYPSKSYRDTTAVHFHENFAKLENSSVTTAGYITALRKHGALAFVDIKDATGKLQLYVKQENLQNPDYENSELDYENLDLLDLGDYVEGFGVVTKTQRGEPSVEITKLRILAKALRPLPDSWEGLKDKEIRLRRRYVDTKVNDEVFQRFVRRAKFWQVHRDFFNNLGFLEINIPVLEHIPGGGDANPFITHMDSIDQDFYLRISQELYLKRLIGGGYEKVYEIGPRFRNEGLSDEHLPEHIAMEFYWAYADWQDGMKLVEELFKHILEKVYDGKQKFTIRGFEVDFSAGWQIIDFGQLFAQKLGIDVYAPKEAEIKNLLKKQNLGDFINIPRGVDALWKILRKDIGGPAFLINHPKYLSPLQKPSKSNVNMVERFQPIIAGSELGNGWSEVNDALDQYERFLEQQAMRDAGDKEAQWLDIDYVEMLEYGMPPTFGYGHSERVFWFLEDVPAREGVPFPQLKFQLDAQTKEIYGVHDIPKSPKSHENMYQTLNIPEKIRIDDSIKNLWSDYVLGYAEIENVQISSENEELERLKKEILSNLGTLTKEKLNNFSEINSYRKAYKDMKVDLHSRKPSPEALLTRLIKVQNIYKVNTCVDAYNLTVMKYRVSMGAFDLDRINFPVVLKVAQGDEKIVLIGDNEPTLIKHGEVCYFDSAGPFNLDINYRDSERTKVSTETRNLMVNVEGVYGINRYQVERSLKEAVEMIQRFCGGTIRIIGIVE